MPPGSPLTSGDSSFRSRAEAGSARPEALMTQTDSTSRSTVGLVGISGYAEIYVDLLLAPETQSRAELSAVVIVPSDQGLEVVEKLRRRGVRIYSSYDELIEAEHGRLDLCIVPTGIQWHARMAMAAMRAGANVLVEKPLAGSLADAEAVRAVEAATGRWVAVGFQDLYTETLAWLKAEIRSGAIGRLKSIRVIGLWPRSGAYYTRNHWAGRLHIDGAATLDSPLNNAFAHFVNLALFLAGSSRNGSTRAEIRHAELFRAHTIESFDTATVTARSPEGIEFWFGVTHACREYREPEIHLQGESGTAGWLHERECFIAPDDGPELRRPVPRYTEARRSMMDHVLSRLRDPTVPVCGTEVALPHTAFIDALHRDHTIQSIAPSLIESCRVTGHASPIPTIPGIETFLDHALRKGCRLSEAGFQPKLVVPG